MIDFYSDTKTRPSRAMREAMLDAPVGDEQKGEDPTTLALEEQVADLLGKKVAVFLPSGTMCNEIALRVWRANLSFWTRLNPPSRQNVGGSLFRLRIATQPGLRPMLAFHGRDERVGSSKRKTHPSRGSPAPTPSTQRPARHVGRFGRGGASAQTYRCGRNVACA